MLDASYSCCSSQHCEIGAVLLPVLHPVCFPEWLTVGHTEGKGGVSVRACVFLNPRTLPFIMGVCMAHTHTHTYSLLSFTHAHTHPSPPLSITHTPLSLQFSCPFSFSALAVIIHWSLIKPGPIEEAFAHARSTLHSHSPGDSLPKHTRSRWTWYILLSPLTK